MSEGDAGPEMDGWSSTRIRQWITTLDQASAPRSVNWWLRTRWTAQRRVYDRGLTAEIRREWAEVALLLTQCAERFAGYDRWTAATDAFNLRGLLIRELGSVPGDETWDLAVLVRSVLATMTLQVDEARELAGRWPTLPIDQIRLLRQHKNALAPLVDLAYELPAGLDSESIRAWLAVRPSLP